jgi:hypothetical protein
MKCNKIVKMYYTQNELKVELYLHTLCNSHAVISAINSSLKEKYTCYHVEKIRHKKGPRKPGWPESRLIFIRLNMLKIS